MRRFCVLLVLCACSANEGLYPPRPAVSAGPPVADPPYSRAVAHISVTRDGLSQLLDTAIPLEAEGTFQLFGERKYTWKRGPLELRFDNSMQRIGIKTKVEGMAELPAKSVTFNLNMLVEVQPVVSARYKVRLQTPVVTIETQDRLLKIAEWGAGIVQLLKTTVEDKLRDQSFDLTPLIEQAYVNASKPLELPIGDAKACVDFGVKGVEMGPTMLIDGFEKDIAIVLGPSVTMPCAQTQKALATLPALTNVASLPTGPFNVTVPVAATYEELRAAATKAFTDGKLFFSKDFPNLYIEKPEIYANGGELVVKVHLDGFVKKGVTVGVAGDLYLSGHPSVHDNQLEFDDMRPTVETNNALLALATKINQEAITRSVKAALRLDISSRLLSVRDKLRDSLTYRFTGGCFKADIGRIEVTNIFAHDAYLRLYVAVQAQATATMPCIDGPESQPTIRSSAL